MDGDDLISCDRRLNAGADRAMRVALRFCRPGHAGGPVGDQRPAKMPGLRSSCRRQKNDGDEREDAPPGTDCGLFCLDHSILRCRFQASFQQISYWSHHDSTIETVFGRRAWQPDRPCRMAYKQKPEPDKGFRSGLGRAT